ncbi:MAG TPA: PAS domain S-box protein, partial [Bacteroidales bacterium]|nr:PAS domain S-box protein [Bacteroidales bacterium]
MTEAKEYLSESDTQQIDLANFNPSFDFEDILNNIPDLICRFLPDTTIIYGNKAYLEAFSNLELALIGQKIADYVPPEDLNELLGFMNLLSEKRISSDYHYQHLIVKGKEIWLRWSIKRIETNRSDYPIIYQGVGKDVTDFKLKEQKVEYLEKLKQFLIRVGVNFTNTPSEYYSMALKELLKEMGNLLEADRTYLFKFDENSSSFFNLFEWCRQGVTYPIYYGYTTPPLSIKTDIIAKHKAGKFWSIHESHYHLL